MKRCRSYPSWCLSILLSVAVTTVVAAAESEQGGQGLSLSENARRALIDFGLDDLAEPAKPPAAKVDEAKYKELRVHTLGLQAAYELRRKRFTTARSALEEALEIVPENYPLRFMLAQVERQTLNDKRATELCDALIKENPDRIEAYELKGQILEAAGKDGEAIDVYSKALERWPICDSLVRRQLDLAFRQGKLDLTISICKRRLEREPKHFFTLWMLGYVTSLKAQESGDRSLFRESAEYYEVALEVRPRATKLYSRLAEIYLALSDQEKAAVTLRRGVVADPTDLEIRKQFERQASPDGDQEKILKAYETLANEYPTAIDIQELYGAQLLARKKYAEARIQFRRLLELQPKNVQTLLALGALDLQMGDSETAKERFRQAADLSGAPETYERIGAAYLSAKRYDDAAEFFERALEQDPEQMAIYFGLARAYQEMGQVDRAVEVVKQGLEKVQNEKGRKPLLVELSRAYQEKGENERAIEVLRGAYEADRTDMLVFFRLADLLLTANEDDEFNKLIDQGSTTFRSARDTFDQELSVMLLDHHRYAAAIPIIESLKVRNRNQWFYYVQLAMAYQRLRQAANGERLFEEARDRLGADSVEFNRFASRYYSMRYENEKAAEAVTHILDATDPPESSEQAGERFALYSSLIFNLGRAGRYTDIENALERANRELGALDPAEMKSLKADAMSQMKKYDEAIALIREMIDKSPEDPDLYYQLGVVLNEARRIDEAEKALRQALALLPTPARTDQERDLRATVLNHLGYMFAEENINLQESASLLNEAMQLEPRAGFIVDSMAWVQFKLGKFDNALQLLKKAIDYSSEDPVLYDHLGDTYARLGEEAKAIESYQKALRLDPRKDDIQEKIDKLKKE